jgi:uncharacterized membrane protein YeaQ/YmgE (transglycosylase-associated protein family)
MDNFWMVVWTLVSAILVFIIPGLLLGWIGGCLWGTTGLYIGWFVGLILGISGYICWHER